MESTTYSLKYPARALASYSNGTGRSQWIVGTNSLREENEVREPRGRARATGPCGQGVRTTNAPRSQVRVLEYDADHEVLRSAAVFTHDNEVWDLAPSPSGSHVATVHSKGG